MPNPVKLATKNFKNQKEAIAFFKPMLYRQKVGEKVNENDAFYLNELLKRHDEYKQKIGVGIDHFTTMIAPHGTTCFKIIRLDGSSTDFSYLHCIRGGSPKRKTEIYKAFRSVVRFDLLNARHKYFAKNKDQDEKVLCPITKERIGISEGQMDHQAPLTFQVIVETFLKIKKLNYDDVPISTGRDNQTSPEITAPRLAEDFRQYHNEIAEIAFVKTKINLKQSAANRIKKGNLPLFQEATNENY
jgi:hypothetical protein